MVSAKVVVLILIVCIIIDEIEAQRNRTRGAGRNRNRGNGNRNRNRGGRNRARGNNRRAGGSRRGGRRCEEIQVPMCKGLIGYTHTKLPNRFNHTTQLQAYRVLEHLWAQIDRGCSQNFRLLACSLFLPRCAGRGPAREPCRKTCKITKRVCESRLEQFGYSWPDELDCNTLPKRRCLKHGPHNSCTIDHTLCEGIDLPMCQNLDYSVGMIPNMFGQCNRTEIATEMGQFQPLVESGCSENIVFFMCGVYSPFCTLTEGQMSFPCRELCEQVRTDCEPEYTRISGGLPWPNKFQCHRYPSADNANYTCVMPNEGGALALT